MVSVDEIVEDAGYKLVLDDGEIITVDKLLTVGSSILTQCGKCPIRERCPAREQSEEVGHCLIEEGLIITATQDLIDDYGVDRSKDKYQIFSFVVNLLHLHRLARMGSKINYGYLDKDNMNVMNKYMAMLAKVDGRYHKSMEQLQATKKEVYKMEADKGEDVSQFVKVMSRLAEKNKVSTLQEQHLDQLEAAEEIDRDDNDGNGEFSY